MEVNYWSCVYLTWYSLFKKVLKSNDLNDKPKIIVVSSINGIIGVPLRTGYAPTKHAIHGKNKNE